MKHRRCRFFGACATALVLSSSVAWALVAAPTATLVDPVIRLEYGTSSTNDKQVPFMFLKIDGLDPPALSQADLITDLKDLGQSAPATLKVVLDATDAQPAGAGSRTWLINARVENLPANSNLKRFVSFSLGGKPMLLAYTLTNMAATPFSWTVKWPPSAIAIHPDEAIPLGIAVGPTPATGVRLLQANLVEKSRKSLASPSGLELCRNAEGSCDGADLNLLAGTPTRLWLRGFTEIGQFDGSINVAAMEKPEGDSSSMSVYVTSWKYQLGGIAVIFLGVVSVWLVSDYGKNRINRDQLLLPAVVLTTKLSALQSLLRENHVPGSTTPIAGQKIAGLLQPLSEAQLVNNNFVPRAMPLPWAATPAVNSLEVYRQLLQATTDWASVLDAVIVGGMQKAWSKWNAGDPAAKATATSNAIATFDGMLTDTVAPPLNAVRDTVNAALRALDAALAGAPLPAAAGLPPPAAPLTPERLNVDIIRLSTMTWLFIALSTTALGSYVLVLSNYGFGSLGDFILCFLWGVGIPVGSQQLAQATGSTVATSLGVTSWK